MGGCCRPPARLGSTMGSCSAQDKTMGVWIYPTLSLSLTLTRPTDRRGGQAKSRNKMPVISSCLLLVTSDIHPSHLSVPSVI